MHIYYGDRTTTGECVAYYMLPVAMELVPYGPGIAYHTQQKGRVVLMFKTFPSLDEARMALAMGWTP